MLVFILCPIFTVPMVNISTNDAFQKYFPHCASITAPEGLNKALENQFKAFISNKVHAYERRLSKLQIFLIFRAFSYFTKHLPIKSLPILQRSILHNLCWNCSANTHMQKCSIQQSNSMHHNLRYSGFPLKGHPWRSVHKHVLVYMWYSK